MARTSKRQEQEEKQVKVPPSLIFDDPVEDLEESQIDELANAPDFDIFEDVGEKLTKAGDRIVYTIKRDGAFIAGAIKHPYSWDRLQKDYGGGTFQVTARSTRKGGYVKSESRNVEVPQRDDEDEEDSRSEQKGNSTADLLMLLNAQKREEREEMQRLEEKRERERLEREERIERERKEREERAEQERKEREAQMKSANDNTMMLMMKMMEQSSSQTTALLTAMIQGNQKKEPELNVEKIMQMMDSRMEKVIMLLQGKDKTKDIDALKLIELQSQAEDKGYRRAMDLQEQAERKAQELADRDAPPAKEENSTTKMLIDSVVPAVQTLLSARGGIPTAQAPAAIPHLPQATVNPHRPAQPPRQPMPGMMGLPRAPMRGVRPPQVVPAQPKVAAAPPAPKKEASPMSQKDLIENTVVTEIGKDLSANLLTQKFDPEGTAKRVLGILKPFGIGPEMLCSKYSLNDMMVIAKAKGMPDAIKPYIERFHACIETEARMGSRGTPESGEPGNS